MVASGGGRVKFCWVIWLWWLEARGKGHHTSHSIIVSRACSMAVQVVMVVFYLLNIIWGSRFKLQVRVQPLLEPEPEPQTPGSKSGSGWVQKVQEPDHGQSRRETRSRLWFQ